MTFGEPQFWGALKSQLASIGASLGPLKPTTRPARALLSVHCNKPALPNKFSGENAIIYQYGA